MSKPTRYSVQLRPVGDGWADTLVEDPGGPWCLYADAAEEIAGLEGEVQRLIDQGRDEFKRLNDEIDALSSDRHARTEALSDRWLRPDGSER